MSNSFLAGIEQDGDKFVLSKPDEAENETSQESPAEPNETESAPSSDGAQASPDSNPKEKNIPFDKHPRWIERENEWKTKFSQVEERLKAFEEAGNRSRSQEKTSIPEPFVRLYGENEEAWKEWKALNDLQRAEIRKEIAEEQDRERQEKAAEERRWKDWVDTSLTRVQEQHGVDFAANQSLKNEFMSFMLKRRPTDEDGNFDFVSGWEWFQETKPKDEEKAKARRSIAAATAPSVKGEAEPKDFFTPSDFRRMGRR